jgi:hypothetical protein
VRGENSKKKTIDSREVFKKGFSEFSIYLPRVSCLSQFVSERSGYSLCVCDQTDQGDETEGFEREGLEMER